MSPVRIVCALAALLLVVVSVPAAGAIVHSAPLAGPPAPVVAVAPPAAASAAKVAPAVEASAPAAAAAPEAAAAKEVPVETMLAPDGTLRLDGTFRGVVDISGWNVTLDPENGPVFTPQGLTYTWGNLGTGLDGLVTGRVNTIAVSGTTVYIGGDFTNLGGNPNINYIARWDGTNWSPLLSGTAGLTSTVHAIVLSGTEVIAGGAFQNAGGNSNANYLARWNGTQWTGFISGTTATGITNTVFTLALSGTHVYAGGAFIGAGSNPNADYIAYWDGGWRSLGTNPLNGAVYTIVFSSTHVYAGGAFTSPNRIAFWNGSNWTALGGGLAGGTGSAVYAITIAGNNVYAGGDFTGNIALSSSGGTWNTSIFGSGVDGTVSATLSLGGGKILVGGTFTTAGGNPARGLAEWDLGNSAWSPVSNFAWNSSDITSVEALVISGGALYVGGDFKDVGRNNANDYVTRQSGTSFVPIGSKTVEPLNGKVETVVISGTDVYVGGSFTNAGNTPGADYIAKWDGTQWSALLSGTEGLNDTVYAIALQGNDVYVGGAFQNAGGNSSAKYLARWDGSKWTGLLSGTDGVGVNDTVYTIAFSGTSQLFVGGAFTSTTPVSLTHIAKANIVTTTGTVTTPVTWSGLVSGTDGIITGTVYTIAISGTDVFVGGAFQNAGGITGTNYIARWDGNIWNAVGSLNAIKNTVRAIARSGNNVYVGGDFIGAGGSGGPNYLALWNGSTWNAVGSPNAINNTVRAIALSGNDVYVGGDFTGAGGAGGANYVARWNGTQWTPLLSNTFGVYSDVHTIALAPNGDVYIGGVFNDTGQNPFADKVAVYKASIVTPTVTAISLGFPSPITITALPQPLSFLVTFSEPVTGVDAADFTVVTSPTTGLTTTIASVFGSGTSYIVNVSVTGAAPGSYTVGLNIPAGATITDLFNLPLGNLPFTGQTYQVNVPSTPVFKVYLSYIAR